MSNANPPSLLSVLAAKAVQAQNTVVDLIRPASPHPSSLKELEEIVQRARTRTDISDHLSILFAEAMASQPRFIVELGVRTGESTFVLERVAKLCGSRIVSVDIDDCSKVSSNPNWIFVQSDDITFSEKFPDWCKERQLPLPIDLLFIDTSHLFEHTVQEIEHWFPLVSPRGKVIFHDTNQKEIFWRKDGSFGLGWKNRGVIAAIEKYFGKQFNETEDFVDFVNGWLIRHNANCNGFTVLTRLPVGPAA